MATLGQALTVFEEDTLTLRFTFSDLIADFNANWEAWIGFAASNFPTSTTLVRAKATTGWTYGSSPGTVNDNGVNVIQNSNVVEVYFNQNDFSSNGASNTLTGGTDYYFELVVSGDGTEDNSIVAATGTFTVNESLFTTSNFRP